jgi:predicted Rossmann-fold nucleotide-binding protein
MQELLLSMKLHKLIALLLATCLITDSAFASLGRPVPSIPDTSRSLSTSPFMDQALAAQMLDARQTLSNFPKSRKWMVVIVMGLVVAHSPQVLALTHAKAYPSLHSVTAGNVFRLLMASVMVVTAGKELPDFKRRLNFHAISLEFKRVAGWLKNTVHAVTNFGSARLPDGDQASQQGKEAGYWLHVAKVPPRTGAGPGAMTSILLGYKLARKAAGDRRVPANMTQGVRLYLEHEKGINRYVEDPIMLNYFVARKFALHRKTLGILSSIGGFGTGDEDFDVWQRGRALALMEPPSGPFEHLWTDFVTHHRRAREAEGYIKPLDYPHVTDDPRDAVNYVLNTPSKHWPGRPLKFPRIVRELQDGLNTMDQWSRAVTFLGRPLVDSPVWHQAGELMHLLLAFGIPVRIATRGPLVEAAGKYIREPSLRKNLQAVLFIPPGEKIRQQEADLFTPTHMVTTHELAVHSVHTLKRTDALVTTPGGKGTVAKLFEIMTLIQTKKIEYDPPIMLLGNQFWKTFLDPLFFSMLQRVPVIGDTDPKYAIDPQTGRPFFSLISLGDDQILNYADSPLAAPEKLRRLMEQARDIPDWHKRPPLVFGPLPTWVLAMTTLLPWSPPAVGLALGTLGFMWGILGIVQRRHAVDASEGMLFYLRAA